MSGVFSFLAQHPLLAIALIATALVVCMYFIKKHFWRIVIIVILTILGYILYINGYFSAENVNRVKKYDFSALEKKVEGGIKSKYNEAKNMSSETVTRKADSTRDDVKDEIMNAIVPTAEERKAVQSIQSKNTPSSESSSANKNSPQKKTPVSK